MCSNLEDDIPVALAKLKLDSLQYCKKCQGKPFVVLQRKDVFCRDCFYEYCSHKFRSTIGKSRKVKPGDQVLIAFSGGASSSAMIDLIKDGLTKPNDHKKLLFQPTILYIRELNYINEDDNVIRTKEQEIIDKLVESNLPVIVSSIEMFYQEDDLPKFVNLSDYIDHTKENPVNCDKCRSKLTDKIVSITTDTGKEDLIRIIKQQLIQQIASQSNFKYIFLGNTSTKTAIQMFTDLALGKGSQITSEHSFIDNRFSVEILKPMREFIKKEITFWNIMRGIKSTEWSTITTIKGTKSSLTKLTENYINGLEHDFPATVYTIFKTGNKLKHPDPNGFKCLMCQSLIDLESKCSAANALQLSHQLSKNLPPEEDNQNAKNLCYSCNNLASEIRQQFVNQSNSTPSKLGIDKYLL